MEPPFFSVIIPTYNRGHFLPRAIDSVRSQTYGDWELWVVDDGSTDETREVLEPYCQQDGRIRYIQQSNQRVSAARNLGLAQTAGKYLCFLDSDDAYREDHLQTFADAIASGLANHLLYTKFMLVKGSDEQVFEPPDRGKSYAAADAGRILSVFLPYSPPVQTICIPASLRGKVFFQSTYNYAECYDFCARCAAWVTPQWIDKATVCLHIHGGNISEASNNLEELRFYSKQLEEFSDMAKDPFYAGIQGNEVFIDKRTQLHANIIKCYFRERAYRASALQFFRLVRWRPSFLFSKQCFVLALQLVG